MTTESTQQGDAGAQNRGTPADAVEFAVASQPKAAAAQVAEDWEGASEVLGAAAQRLEASGAKAVTICANLMHKVAPEVAARIDVSLVHIADAMAD